MVVDQLVPLQPADTVLGAEAPAQLGHEVMDHPVEPLPMAKERRFFHAHRLAEIEVNVAVADMTEGKDPDARQFPFHHRRRPGDELRDAGDRHGHVMLDAGAFANLRFRQDIAQVPDLPGLGPAGGDHRVRDQPGIVTAGKKVLEALPRLTARLAGRKLHQDVPGRPGL